MTNCLKLYDGAATRVIAAVVEARKEGGKRKDDGWKMSKGGWKEKVKEGGKERRKKWMGGR